MSSKVTAKLRLGAAFSVLLISLTLLAGCKQDADNSYTPPGYGASVGPLTDTVWKDESGATIRFGAEGKVVDVPKKWNVLSVRIQISDRVYQAVQAEFNDFTYSGTNIYGKVTKVGEEWVDYLEVGDRVKVATFTVPTTTNQDGQNIPVTNYYKMGVTIEGENTPSFFTMDNKPTSGDAFVGTYYDEQGRKGIQINKDNTFVTFTDGEHRVSYWKDKNDGTIYVKSTQFDNSPNEFSGGSTYYLYPHALMSGGSVKAWK